MFESMYLSIALIGSIIAGLWDFKTTNIPDSLCIGMIIAGIGLHALESFLTNNFSIISNSFLFGGIFFAFSLAMYYLGQWGGGDGELMVAIGFLLPGLSLDFFINLFFVGAVYSIIYSFAFIGRNPILKRKVFQNIKGSLKPFMALVFASALFSIMLYYIFPIFALFPIIFIVLFLLYKILKVVDKIGFYKKIPSAKLKEDDMIGEDIPKLKIYKKFIRGLTKQEVAKIKKTKKYVLIREGVRFGLVFPITLILTILAGNLILLIW